MPVPALRLRDLNGAPIRPGGDHVLYWMIAARRAAHSFALDRAAERCRALGRPLLVLEALRAGHPFASDRLHAFVLQGMADNAAAFAAAGVAYHPYVEPRAGEGRGLLDALAARACCVVTDDSPAFFLPRMLAAAAARLPVRVEAVDGIGLLPLRVATRALPTAHAFRRILQRELPAHLDDLPSARPLARLRLPRARLSRQVTTRWPRAGAALLATRPGALASLAIDHGVTPVGDRGGAGAAAAALVEFMGRLARYADERDHPDADAGSGLSPWLHFGHLSPHQVFTAVAAREGWTPRRLSPRTDGRRAGWWGMSPSAEAFLDQLVTWRELCQGFAHHRADASRYDALPPWALATLARHRSDPRPHRYSPEELEAARTHDPLWNAAQRQLRATGRMHGYLRMLWGKKILEWSEEPEAAWETMLALNDRYALDGRDPNSLGGIAWCLGRFDRPWGPERPVFGTVRYMTSQSAARKLRLRRYLETYAEDTGR